jgi:hypothetical protein
MRQYIRHPSDIPITYSLADVVETDKNYLRDISRGGLCFHVPRPLQEGARIHIEIPVAAPAVAVDGTIVWCQPEEDEFAVGARFDDGDDEFKIRMVEQVCYIEHYRNEVYHRDGRQLTSDQAAAEWITTNAGLFPR